jgi:hypothetical protein
MNFLEALKMLKSVTNLQACYLGFESSFQNCFGNLFKNVWLMNVWFLLTDPMVQCLRLPTANPGFESRKDMVFSIEKFQIFLTFFWFRRTMKFETHKPLKGNTDSKLTSLELLL